MSLIHRITLGHLDRSAVALRKVSTERPLDRSVVDAALRQWATQSANGAWKLGGFPVGDLGSHVVVVVYGPWLVAEAVSFIRDVVRGTGCTAAEVEHAWVEPDPLTAWDDEDEALSGPPLP